MSICLWPFLHFQSLSDLLKIVFFDILALNVRRNTNWKNVRFCRHKIVWKTIFHFLFRGHLQSRFVCSASFCIYFFTFAWLNFCGRFLSFRWKKKQNDSLSSVTFVIKSKLALCGVQKPFVRFKMLRITGSTEGPKLKVLVFVFFHVRRWYGRSPLYLCLPICNFRETRPEWPRSGATWSGLFRV